MGTYCRRAGTWNAAGNIQQPLVDYRMFLYAALLLMMIRFLPGGLLGGSTVLSLKNLKKKKEHFSKEGGKVE